MNFLLIDFKETDVAAAVAVVVDAAEDDGARVAERAQVEGKHVGRQQPLRHYVVEKRHGAGRRDRG